MEISSTSLVFSSGLMNLGKRLTILMIESMLALESTLNMDSKCVVPSQVISSKEEALDPSNLSIVHIVLENFLPFAKLLSD